MVLHADVVVRSALTAVGWELTDAECGFVDSREGMERVVDCCMDSLFGIEDAASPLPFVAIVSALPSIPPKVGSKPID